MSLPGSSEFSPQLRRKLVQEAQPGSLAERALTTYDEKQTAAEQEYQRKQADQEEKRQKWAVHMEERIAPRLTAQLAERLRLAADDPAVAALRWRIDPENLSRARFTEGPGAIAPEGEMKLLDMFAEVSDGVLIRASNYGTNESRDTILSIVTDPHTGSSTGLRNLADLGAAIAEATKRQS